MAAIEQSIFEKKNDAPDDVKNWIKPQTNLKLMGKK